MSSYKRNLMVGLTVLVAIGVFGWMIIEFGTKAAKLFAAPQVAQDFLAARGDGLSDGSVITYQGVAVGRVIRLQRNENGSGIVVHGVVDTTPPVPINVTAQIVTTNLIGGGSAISLELQKNPATLIDQLPRFGEAGQPRSPIQAQYIGLQLNILPPVYGQSADAISHAAQEFAQGAASLRQEGFYQHMDDVLRNLNQQVSQTGKVLASIQGVLGDSATQTDLRQTIENVHTASVRINDFSAQLPQLAQQASATLADAHGTITSTRGHVDDLSKQVGDRLMQVSQVLDQMHGTLEAVNHGHGTAAMLLNDPQLYAGLVDASRTLDATLVDVKRLIEQWEQEGLGLHLR